MKTLRRSLRMLSDRQGSLRTVFTRLPGCVAPVFGIALVVLPVFAMEGNDHIYCTSTGGDSLTSWHTYYYTDVFRGDYLTTAGFKHDFQEYLAANEPGLFFQYSSCFYGRTREEAEDLRSRDVQATKRNGYRIVRTKWAPANVGGRSDARSFRELPIRDLAISVPDTPYAVEVCVRDHQCEDGDRVHVSVNGSPVLDAEIVDEWNCQTIALGMGHHRIELYAVNGTGYKGDCSYADVNTGELRVTGANSQTQSWRHRGGKGSRANIVVSVQPP